MKRAVCLMTLVPALLAACGDDDSAPETPIATSPAEEPARLSKEQYITQADGICAEVNAALGALSGDTASAAGAAGQRADLYESLMENLRDLGTPRNAAGLEDFLAAGDDLVAAERDAEQAALDGDDTALAAAESDAAAAGTTFSGAASSFGFENCGQGPTDPAAAATAPPSATAPVTPAEPVPTTPAVPETPPAPSGGAGTPDAGGGTGTGGTTGGSGGVGPR